MKRQLKVFILWAIIGTGVSSIAVQLVTVREFLSQFHGNEITISLVLFSWLLLTGLGSFVAKAFRWPSVTVFTLVSGLHALWPLAQLILIRALRESVFVHGAAPGFNQTALYILATIAPYCLLLGFILPYALRVLNERWESLTSGGLYVTDSIGDITGGILFSFVLVYSFTPFATVAITSGLLIVVVLLLFLALPGGADLPRRARVPDLRRGERHPAAGHRPRARRRVSAAMSLLKSPINARSDEFRANAQAMRVLRSEGVFFAARSFIDKSVSGLGILLSALLIAWIGRPGEGDAADRAQMIERLGAGYAIGAVVLYAIAIACYARYRIDRAGHARNLERLAERGAASS